MKKYLKTRLMVSKSFVMFDFDNLLAIDLFKNSTNFSVELAKFDNSDDINYSFMREIKDGAIEISKEEFEELFNQYKKQINNI